MQDLESCLKFQGNKHYPADGPFERLIELSNKIPQNLGWEQKRGQLSLIKISKENWIQRL